VAQWRAVIDLAPTVAAPAAARKVVAAVLRGWGLAGGIADAEQVVTELVTNAVRHAPGPACYELELVGHSDGVRVYVADGSAARPVVVEQSPLGGHGRGMRIVQALAASWGADEHHGGKRVWADLALESAHQDARVLPFQPHTPRH
jgi:anti-sigma regulatory factor (Ser/Thr protein kinase)